MPDIKLVSYNLDHGILRQKISENIKELAERGTQLFCLQEVRTPKNSEEFIGDTILKNLGEGWRSQFFLSHGSKNDYGLGFLWNSKALESVEFHNISFPLLPRLTLLERFIETFLSGDTRPVKRGGMIATFKAGQEVFRVSNIHLDWQGKFEQRFTQLEYLFGHLQASPMQNEIICGDFNTVGFFGNADQVEKIQSLFGPEFVNCFPKFVLTTSHHQQLDHIFACNFLLRHSEVLKVLGSDHYPIAVELDLSFRSKPLISAQQAVNQG